ncbi:polyprotein [Cosavirus JMY-2014]|uniref:polyprotein n=1 Tax=Cosavirus JMY-2014 TaxID=1582094 RepID=UPI000549E3EB|nr:polyprotein [Cosavirus JMY-2014]AIZ66891.1 polyprotein [Cosavirus JMY-2014]
MGANNSKESASTTGNEGTVVNNFYANNYYGSIDASSQGVGTSTTPENGNVSGFLGLASSAFNALSFLADPKTETETNMEDRILTRTAGNTSINSQASEGVLFGYGRRSDSSCPTSCGDRPTRGTPATSRAFVVPLADWNINVPPYYFQAYRLTQHMYQDEVGNMFTKNLRTHAFCKTGFEVTLQVNTSPFHAGLLGLFLVPEFVKDVRTTLQWDSIIDKLMMYRAQDPSEHYENQTLKPVNSLSFDLADITPEQMMLFPHQLINPKETNIATVSVPYVNCAPTSDVTIHNVWTAVVMVLSRLNYADGASPLVAMTLTVTPVDTVFNGLHHSPSNVQSPFPTRPFHHSFQFSSTVPDVTEPCYGMTVTGPRDYLPPPITDLLSLVKVPSLMTVSYVSNSDDPNVEITNAKKSEPLFTANVVISDLHFQHTLVGQLSKYFCNYRGSIQISSISATTAMTRGKLLFSYTPPGAGKPLTLEQAMQGTYSIWDLGLQSSFHFTIPFISAVDYRISAVSASSAVNSDGWFTIWLLNPLTYPPGSPPTQRIVLFCSAGDDFSYRNPISPPYLQSPDPHDNLESGTSKNTDAGLNSGHNVGMINNHSNCSFFYDRYRFLGLVESSSNAGPKINSPYNPTNQKVKDLRENFKVSDTQRPYSALALSPIPSIDGSLITTYLVSSDNVAPSSNTSLFNVTTGDRHLYNSCPFTYIHCDLEVTVKPPLGFDKRWRVTWYPPGAPIDTATVKLPLESDSTHFTSQMESSGSLMSLNPTFYGKGDNAVSFVIPFCSPLSAIPLYFDGYPDYKRGAGGYGIGPAASFGTITIDANTNKTMFSAFIRYKNFKGYVPRPLIRYPTIDPNRTQVKLLTFEGGTPRPITPGRYRVQKNILLSGDVETNPGPCNSKFYVQSPLSEFLQVAKKPETLDNVTRLLNTLNNVINKWNELKTTMTDAVFLRDMVCLIVKLMSLGYLVKNGGPGSYFAAASVLLCDGITFFDWYEKIRMVASKYFRTPPPPFALVQGLDLRDVVTFFNAAKGLQWMVDTIRALINWLKKWMDNETENDGIKLEQMLIDSPPHCKAIHAYNRGETFKKPTDSFQFIDKLIDLATAQGKLHMASYFKNYVADVSDPCRPEPVVIVLRGKPGAGKSAAATVLAAAISKMIVGEQSVYTLSPDTDHMDGYTGQYVVIMDDLGQNPDGEDFRYFCQMVSTTCYRPAMADLKDKGILFTSRVLIVTTNLQDFSPITISDPRALERRITFDILVSPGPAATRNGKLDLARALQPDGPGEGPFTNDCALLHTTGLNLKNLRNGKEFNLVDLVEKTVKKVQEKKTVCGMLEGLVVQSPNLIVGYTKDDDGVVIVDSLEEWHKIQDKKRKQQVLETISEELDKRHKEHQQFWLLMKQFVSALGVLAAVGAAYGTYKYFSKEKQPEEEEEKSVDEPDNNKVEGPYNNISKDLKKLKLRVQTPIMDLEKKISKNVLPFKLNILGKNYTQSCVAIGKRVIIVNKHAVECLDEVFYVGEKQYRLSECEFCALETDKGVCDVAAIKLPNGPEFKNIVNLFVPYSASLHAGTRLVILSNDDIQMVREGSFLRNEDYVPTNIGDIPCVFLYKASSYFGMCGSVVSTRFSDNPGILGIHCAGGGGVCVAARVSRRMLEELMLHFYPLQAQGSLVELADGPRVHVPRTTKFKRTNAVYPATSKCGPAVLSRNDPRLDPDIDFDKQIFSKHNKNVNYATDSSIWNTMTKVTQIYFEKFGKHDWSPLTLKEAIEGIPGLDKLDPNTASGLPYTKTRKQLIDFTTCEIKDSELQARLDKWLKGEKPELIYQTFLKDEIRSIEKIKKGKTRIIDVTPLDHVLAFRILFGRFFAHFHQHFGFGIGSAVGCDPDTAWPAFGAKLASYKNQYDFDYSNFDASHSTDSFALLRDFFFTPENGFDSRCSLMLDSLAVSIHSYEDKRYSITGGLPSGTAGTSVINTLINNVIFRSALYHTYSNFEWDDVILMAYGDDIVAASDYDLDLSRVKEFMAKIGYTITPANKGENFTQRPLTEIQFLKRYFGKQNGMWVPIMQKENLEMMLSWYKPGTLQEKLDSVAQLAHFSGEDTYKTLFQPFINDGFKIKPWKQLHFEWLNKFKF